MSDLERALKRGAPGEQAAPAQRLVDRADQLGLLDVAYATLDSPIGPLVVAATRRGVVRLAFAGEGLDAVLAELAERLSPRVLEAPDRLDALRHQLDEYFAGARDRFDVRVDWSLSRGFVHEVLRATARVPYGSVSSYARIAAAAGSPRAFRAAGSALGRNPIAIVVPCHRIVRTGGGLGGYRGGLDRKRFLLRLEGTA